MATQASRPLNQARTRQGGRFHALIDNNNIERTLWKLEIGNYIKIK